MIRQFTYKDFKKTCALTLFIICIVLSIPFKLFAQPPGDLKSKEIKLLKATNIEGDIFFNSSWMNGNLTLKNGSFNKKIKLKYDISYDRVWFLDEQSGQPMILENDIKSFTLLPSENSASTRILTFENSFPAIDQLTGASFYEVLNEGNTKLLKHIAKYPHNTKTFNSATTTTTYNQEATYYLYKSNKISKITAGKKAIINALKDKEQQIKNYLAINKIDFNNDDDLAMLFIYYNSL